MTLTPALILAMVQAAPTAQAPQKVTATKEELEAVCRAVLCRQPRPIRLKLEDGRPFEVTPRYPSPIVTDEAITIMPGETIMVEGSLTDGRLVNLKAVVSPEHPERTIVFTFRQEPSLNDGTGMLLKVDSPFPGVLKYVLGMMHPSGGGLRKTSACPLTQGVSSYEHWPHPIFQLVAAKFRLVDPSSEDATRCE